jgi:hypothetical protein
VTAVIRPFQIIMLVILVSSGRPDSAGIANLVIRVFSFRFHIKTF